MKLWLTFCLLALLWAGSAHAQTDTLDEKTNTLRGTVTAAATGQPVAHARVKVVNTKLGAITTAEGTYRIERLPIGHYSVRVTSSEYASQTQEIVVGTAHQAVLDFVLQDQR